MGGETQKHFWKSIIGLFFGIVVFFGLCSLQSLAQQTGAPGQDTDSSNISELIRISNPDGKQVKSGAFRVGNSGTIDISSSFEVFGDVHGSGSLLVAAQGACNYMEGENSVLEPSCAFSNTQERHPTFVADVNANYVGVGTNIEKGKLSVYSGANEFVNGALYATSSSGHGVWGVAQAANMAGVFGIAVEPNSVAVFGKSIDKYSWGVSGFSDSTGKAPAGLFWGNVIVTGGYIQGNASGLYRVSSINDASLAVSEGGRGLGVWGNKDPITIGAASTTQVTNADGFPFKSGERIRSFSVFIRVKNTGNYVLLTNAIPVTASMTTTALKFVNTSDIEYEAKVFAHIENTLSITVQHITSDGGVYAVDNIQPVQFVGSGLYELKASVGPGQSPTFTWQFDTSSPKGQLCDKQFEGVAVNCVPPNSGSIDAETVYYKFPPSYTNNTWQDQIKVTWSGSEDVTRTFTIKVIDIQVPSAPILAQYNAGNELATASRVPIPVTYITPSGISDVSELTFVPVIPEGESSRGNEAADPISGYRAPGINLDDEALGSRGVTAPIAIYPTTNPEVKKLVTVYLVPEITVLTKYISGDQNGVDTNTVGVSRPLTVDAIIGGYTSPQGTLSCGDNDCFEGQVNLPAIFQVGSLGAKNIAITWHPPTGYPPELSVVKNKTIYVSRLVASDATGSRNTNIVIPVTVDFGVTGAELTQLLSQLPATAYQLNRTVPIAITDYSLNPHVKGGNARVTAITSVGNNNTSEVTFNSDSCNGGSAFALSVRNPGDLREVKNIVVTVTGCSAHTCTNCAGCPNDPKHCDTCCSDSPNW
ncbi:MAG: hypothetical protein WC495_03910 [Patescibacteria group bacterium]